MNTFKKGIATFFISISLFMASLVSAETQVEIDYDSSSFKDKKLSSGAVEVLVNYDKQETVEDDINNLRYQIFYNGVSQVNSSDSTTFSGGVSLKDLDGNGISEVIIRTFSGGTHCCSNFTVYTRQLRG